MPRYHFSVGDSTNGPIGIGASIEAGSREEALAILRDSLQEAIEVCIEDGPIEYVCIYINHDAFSVEDIDGVGADDD